METLLPIIPILASALAALIAAAVAYVVAVLSKEQKTSEFRQAWIDALRSDIADMIAGRTEVALAISAKVKYGHENAEILDFLFKQFPDLVSTKAKYHRIVLRLNPKKHSELLASLKVLDAIPPLQADEDLVESSANQVTQHAQKVLKTEWERVKRGETVYRWTKRVAASVMILAVLVAIIAIALRTYTSGAVPLRPNHSLNRTHCGVPSFAPPFHSGSNAVTPQCAG